MRRSGVLDSTRGLNHSDHICWGFSDHEEFLGEALQFLCEGLELGQKLLYTAPGSPERLCGDLGELDDLGRLIDRGVLEILPLDHTYSDRYRPGAAEQAEAYAVATDMAVADGFTGLRVAAEATALVLDPGKRDAFTRYEHLVDRMMARGLPFAAMCGYDRNRLGQSVVDELACVHPARHGTTTPFGLHAGDEAQLCLTGEIDAWDATTAAVAFARTFSATTGPRLELDSTHLDFIHHRGLEAMHDVARDLGIEVHLIDATSTVERMVELLQLDTIHSVPA